MKSSKRSPSGAKIAPHSKNDMRGSHILRGSPLTKTTRVTYVDQGGRYRVAPVKAVLRDAAGVSYNNLRWLTVGAIVSTTPAVGEAPVQVRITHRNSRTAQILGRQI